jgi:hypothetical protein
MGALVASRERSDTASFHLYYFVSLFVTGLFQGATKRMGWRLLDDSVSSSFVLFAYSSPACLSQDPFNDVSLARNGRVGEPVSSSFIVM